jgi:UDPglucose 6-dehydrogenase
MKVSIVGLGFVGGAMKKSFELKGIDVIAYDKYKDSNSFDECLHGKFIFLCLPTQFNENTNEYDKEPIYETCQKLTEHNYQGLVVIKSTVEPETTANLGKRYPTLKFVHKPEFLTAATAFEDFHNQKHIVLGKGLDVNDEDIFELKEFFSTLYPSADISLCNSTESESMKSFVNCFYAVKIQFFNELYQLCQKNGTDYNIIKDLMLKNGWINPMHTIVPGTDGQLSYGGYCFPKDTNALLNYMKNSGSEYGVLEATIRERNLMRNDHTNILKN